MRSTGLRHHAGPLALFAALAVLLTWPGVLHLGTAIPGAATSDAYDHYWGYAWFASTLGRGELPLHTDLSHWPPGGSLWFIDPLGALVSLPFQAVLGAAAGYTLALLVQVWGGMAGGYALGWSYSRERAPAVLTGVIFGASPYVLSLLYSGTVEYLSLAPLPLFWLSVRHSLTTDSQRGARSGSRLSALAAAACWAWATLGNFYYAAFCALLLAIAVVSVGTPWRSRLLRAGLVGLGAAVLAGPVLAVAARTLSASDAVVTPESAPGWNYRSLPATDLLTFLHPGAYYFPDNRKMGNEGIIHVNYLGWLTLALAIVGAWRHRPLRLPLALAAVLALGPTLALHGAPVRFGGSPVPLPDTLLYLPGSPFRFVHHPFRLVVLLMMFAGGAAACATVGRPRLALLLSAGILAEALLASPAVWPLPTAPVTAPDYYHRAHDDPTVRGIWDFPPNAHRANRWYQALAVTHGKRIPYGVNSFLPRAFADNHLVRALLQCLRRPASATLSREGGRPLEAFLQRPNAAKIPEGRRKLRTQGYDVVAVHTGLLQASEATCVEQTLGGIPMVEPGLSVYALDVVGP